MKGKRKLPEIIMRDGKPVSVILDIEAYQELLERLDDAEDLRRLEEIRKKVPEFRKFDDFLKDMPVSA